MPSLPASYDMNDHLMLFQKQYKHLAVYCKSTDCIVDVHVLTAGRKLSLSNDNILTVTNAPTGTFYKKTYVMDSDGYVQFTPSALIIGTGDQREGGITIDNYSLISSNCTVIIQYENVNQISVSTTCGNNSCTVPSSECFSTSTQQDVTVYT